MKKKKIDKFHTGDIVFWTSQSQGNVKSKQGVVKGIVPKGKNPNNHCPTYRNRRFIDSMPRDHRSYLVQIGRQCHLYWPRVCHLRRTAFK